MVADRIGMVHETRIGGWIQHIKHITQVAPASPKSRTCTYRGGVPGTGPRVRTRTPGGRGPGVGQASRVSIIAESGQGSPVETRTFFH